MSSRTALTVLKIADYLWYLLPGFMKKKERVSALLGKICDILGEEFDDVRETLALTCPETMAVTATGTYLDRLARLRHLVRRDGETDEDFRVRVLNAFTVQHRAGTIPGITQGLADIGYTVEVLEPYKGTPYWSYFVVKITAWDGLISDWTVFYRTLRKLKPAHTLALVESELAPRCWNEEPDRNQGVWNEWIHS